MVACRYIVYTLRWSRTKRASSLADATATDIVVFADIVAVVSFKKYDSPSGYAPLHVYKYNKRREDGDDDEGNLLHNKFETKTENPFMQVGCVCVSCEYAARLLQNEWK